MFTTLVLLLLPHTDAGRPGLHEAQQAGFYCTAYSVRVSTAWSVVGSITIPESTS